MSDLTDYVDLECLQYFQDMFCAAADRAFRVCTVQGEPLTDPSPPADARPCAEQGHTPALGEAPIVVGQRTIGTVRLAEMDALSALSPQAAHQAERFLKLMAETLGRLCRQENLLHTRVGELATLYRLTAEFTARKDIQDVLDQVASTVVRTLKAKACTIRLLDDSRKQLLVRAAANLTPEYLDKGPILLSKSRIDQQVLATLNPVYIADQRKDPRVLYPAEARREGIVSALCAPLVYRGRAEGVIRVYTGSVHEFDWFEASLLQAIAANAAAAIVNARLYQEAVRGATMRRHLRLAGVVQRRMIPEAPPEAPGFDIGAVYVPCFELGGDFYDFIELPEDNVGVAVCDVVGKGVRASLLMASTRASLRANAEEIYDMAEVLSKVNRVLCADSQTSDFATMFYGVLDLRSRRLTYANAGHPPPILFRDGQMCYLDTGGGLVGISSQDRWEYESLLFHSGDVLLAYTDGLPDAMNFDDETFGRARIEQATRSAIEQGMNAEGIVKHVLWEMRRFAGLQKRFDDLTMVAIKVL